MNNILIQKLISVTRNEDGQALAEYSLILAFIAMVCVVALGAIGLAVSGELGGFAAGIGGGGGS